MRYNSRAGIWLRTVSRQSSISTMGGDRTEVVLMEYLIILVVILVILHKLFRKEK